MPKKPGAGRTAPRPKKAPLGSTYTGTETGLGGNQGTKPIIDVQTGGVYSKQGPALQGPAPKKGGSRSATPIANNTPIEKVGGDAAKYQKTALKLGTATKGARREAKQTISQRKNAKQMGIADTSPTVQRKKRTGGTVTRDGGGGSRDRFTGDRGGLPTGTRDNRVVGSRNVIDNFDGSSEDFGDGNEFSGGFADVGSAGGGGSGSALAGRESVSRVDLGKIEGQSMEDVVYGVKKAGKKYRGKQGE